MKISNSFKNLTRFEWTLWAVSAVVITVSFFISGEFEILTLIASLVGITALIFVAKGDVLGQLLTIIFAIIYGIISYKSRYYGEMITYLGMTAPIALLSVITWLKHPYENGKNEVEIALLNKRKVIFMCVSACLVTFCFYFILKYFNTANLTVSTISVTTSFVASYLTLCRNPFYALAYAANDIVLIILWISASLDNPSYIPMIMCFIMFFCNDLYGFVNWRKMSNKQNKLN